MVNRLEESEITYWSKYYTAYNPLKSSSLKVGGAFVGAVPEIDILAMNRVIGLGLWQEFQIKHIEEIIAFYRKEGVKRFFLQLCPQIMNDSIERMLLKAGFQFHNNWVKLAKQTDAYLPSFDSTLKVVQVDRSRATEYAEVLFKSFDWKDDRLIDWLASVVGIEGYRHYMAYIGKTPVAAAAMHHHGNIASMAFAGTLPEFRGVGAQILLINTRLEKTIGRGVEYVVAETAEEKPGKQVQSYRNLCRMGFHQMYLRQNWLYQFKQ